MRMGMQSLQISKLRWGRQLPHRSSGSRVPDPERQPKRECPAGVRPEIRAPLFRLPRIVAHAELLRPEIQRQWLPVNERSGCPDLAKRLLLAHHIAHYSLLESRERQQSRGRYSDRNRRKQDHYHRLQSQRARYPDRRHSRKEYFVSCWFRPPMRPEPSTSNRRTFASTICFTARG